MTIAAAAPSLIDAGLRGGALALLALLALNGARHGSRDPLNRVTVVFDLCAIAYLIETAPGLRGSHAAWLMPVRVASVATPAVFLVWAQTAFEEEAPPRLWRWLPFCALLALGVVAVATGSWIAWRTTQVASLALAAAGIAIALAGRGGELGEARRRARLVFACGLGACIAVTTLLGALKAPLLPAASSVAGIALAAALLRLRIDSAADPPPSAVSPPSPSAAPAPPPMEDAEERALHARLVAAMEHDRLHREGGLTVSGLAGRLGVPEYRLRRLINQRLGHRNFPAFLNSYRLAEAMAALADPLQARVPVLTIALDCGFQSIGPFNRAFKAQTGETPTEFRARHLSPARVPAAG